jgi:endonuclease III
MRHAEEHAALVRAATAVYGLHKQDLERIKEEHRRAIERPDFLWAKIVESFANWGGPEGWELLIQDPDNLSRLTYAALARLSSQERHREIQGILKESGVKWPNKKAAYLDRCFQQIEDLGGPEEAKRLFLEQEEPKAQERFLMALPGIGPSCARALVMDAQPELFQETITVDKRIKRISTRLALRFSDHATEKRFYRTAAEEMGITPRELETLLLHDLDEVLDLLEDEGY